MVVGETYHLRKPPYNLNTSPDVGIIQHQYAAVPRPGSPTSSVTSQPEGKRFRRRSFAKASSYLQGTESHIPPLRVGPKTQYKMGG